MNSFQNDKSYQNILFLQVLGNSDVRIDSKDGYLKLKGNNLEDLNESVEILEDELNKTDKNIEFPFLKKVIETQKEEKCHLYLGIILSDQRQWIQDNNISKHEWNPILGSDGIWWNNLLKRWLDAQQEHIEYCPIIFEVDPQIKKGASDWEGMSKDLAEKLQELVKIKTLEDPEQKTKTTQIIFQYEQTKQTPIERIIIQYSSGTPALSSALYLWGIELTQRLKLIETEEEICPLEFVYFSRQDSEYYSHSGEHWQWRLKVPQLERLLEIQDFAGVLTLLGDSSAQETHNQNRDQLLKERLKQLDYANSLNLKERLKQLDYANSLNLKKRLKQLDYANSFNLKQLQLNLTPEDQIIERISIALWSEKAFREKGQWMSWYLRLAGGFELGILALVKQQSSKNNIQWKEEEEQGIKLVKLKYQYDSNFQDEDEIKSTTIKYILNDLLGKGEQIINKQKGKSRQINPIKNNQYYQDDKWENFKEFYTANGQNVKFSQGEFKGFSLLRHKLYHTLQGDLIDEQLDHYTKELKSATHTEHPASIAVANLEYILQLANLSEKIAERVKHYENMVEKVKASF